VRSGIVANESEVVSGGTRTAVICRSQIKAFSTDSGVAAVVADDPTAEDS